MRKWGSKAAKRKDGKAVEAQAKLVAIMKEVDDVFAGTSTVMLLTTLGDVIALHTREGIEEEMPEEEVDPEVMASLENDFPIPADLVKMDEEATAGDPEFDELVVAIAAAVRFSRQFATDAFQPEKRRRRRQPKKEAVVADGPPYAGAPLFRCVGEVSVFSCYGVGPDCLLAFYSQASATERHTERQMGHIIAKLRATLGVPPPPPPPENETPAAEENNLNDGDGDDHRDKHGEGKQEEEKKNFDSSPGEPSSEEEEEEKIVGQEPPSSSSSSSEYGEPPPVDDDNGVIARHPQPAPSTPTSDGGHVESKSTKSPGAFSETGDDNLVGLQTPAGYDHPETPERRVPPHLHDSDDTDDDDDDDENGTVVLVTKDIVS